MKQIQEQRIDQMEIQLHEMGEKETISQFHIINWKSEKEKTM